MARRFPGCVLAAVVVFASACYTDDAPTGDGPKPAATVLLTDAPFPFDTVQSVNVYIVSIAVSVLPDTATPADSTKWVTVTEPKRRVNLLALQQGVTTLLGIGEIPADRYRAARIIIDTDSSDIRFTDGATAVVHWGGSGIQAIHMFVEAAMDVPDQGTEIVIDFDVGRSFHYDDLGDGAFNFFPWVRAVNKAATGSIAGVVTGTPDSGAAAPLANATVSAYGASQGTWQIYSTGKTDATGHYRLAYLLPGTYIVQTNAPRAGGWATDLDSNVAVTKGVETLHNINLTAFHGSIYILGAASMLVADTNTLEAIVVTPQNQQDPNAVVTWQNLDTLVLGLADSLRFARVTAKTVGTGRVVAQSGALVDTLVIQVVPDSTPAGAVRR